MTTPIPIIIPYEKGLSINEQKCYLLHQGNNEEIIKCLEALQISPWVVLGTIVAVLALIVLLTLWET